MEENHDHPICLGSIVKLKQSFLREPIGTLAYVYETYNLGEGRWKGVCIITENGVDLGGFSGQEQASSLEKVAQTDFRYRFINMIQLGEDVSSGVFSNLFKNHKEKWAVI